VTDGTRVFVEREPREVGFAAVWDRVVAPELDREEERWRRGGALRRRCRTSGAAIIVGSLAAGVALALAGGTAGPWLALPVAAVGSWLGWEQARAGRLDGRRLRELLIAAACEHRGDIIYQRVALRRVEFDHHAELALVPRYTTALVEDFFQGRHRELAFRMIEAELRDGSGRRVFHGLLLEIDAPVACRGRITIAHRRDGERRPLPGTQRLGDPPGAPVVLKTDPLFHRRFDLFADDEESARVLLTPRVRAALGHLADHWGAVPWQAGHAWGKLMVALPVAGDAFEPRSVTTLHFDPVGDARRMIEELHLPYRIIDALAGIESDTGRRL